jgi:hypothetical protein
MGVHTRLTDEAEPWKIKRTLEMVREMGAPWIVEYFPWAYYEPRPGHYEWGHPDLVIDFAAEFVRRYTGKADYVIIWNEPNLTLEWGYRPVDPAGYVEMLRVIYPMIKEANPDVQVLAGALAPTLAPPGSEWGMNDLTYLQRMYDAGAADFFDVLAVHAYGWYSDADEPPDPEVINFRRTELLHDIMVQNGDGDKPVMITEGGWNDHPRWTRAVRPGQRIRNTISAYEIAHNEWPWLKNLSFWAFRYPWDTQTYQDYFTFVDTEFEPKAIYLEVQAYARGWQVDE